MERIQRLTRGVRIRRQSGELSPSSVLSLLAREHLRHLPQDRARGLGPMKPQ